MAEQVKLLLVVTPLLGLIETLVTTGSVLSRETLALAESVAPSASVAVASHSISSLGDAVAVVKVTDDPVPRVCPVVVLLQE